MTISIRWIILGSSNVTMFVTLRVTFCLWGNVNFILVAHFDELLNKACCSNQTFFYKTLHNAIP